MHKKRQAQTRRGKLHGLTPSEARQRTIKGWITKHSRYHYGSASPSRAINPRFRKVAEERQERFQKKLTKHLESQPWWNDLSEAERHTILEAEFEQTRGHRAKAGVSPSDSGEHPATPNEMSAAQWKAYQVQQALHWAQHSDFQDESFKRYVSNLPPQQRRGFEARVMRLREIEQSQREKVDVIDAVHVVETPEGRKFVGGTFDKRIVEGGTRTPGQSYSHTGDEAYIHTDNANDWQAVVRNRLHRVVNKDTSKSVAPSTSHFDTQRESVEKLADNIDGLVDQMIGARSGDLLSSSKEPELVDDIKQHIWDSYTAPTKQARDSAARSARTKIDRAAQIAGEAHERAVTRDAFIEMDQKLWEGSNKTASYQKGVLHSTKIPEDPRFEVGFKRRRHEGNVDRRLAYEPETVESMYETSGHYDKSVPFHERIRRQADFLVDQHEAHIRGLAEGTSAWALQGGKVVPLTDKSAGRVDYGMAPNKEHVYLLNSDRKDKAGNYLPPYEKSVDTYDRGTRFAIGRRREAQGWTYRKDDEGKVMKFKVDDLGNFVTEKRRVLSNGANVLVDTHKPIPDPNGAPMKVFTDVHGVPGTLLPGHRDEIAVDDEGKSIIRDRPKYDSTMAYDAPEYRPLSKYRERKKPEGVDEVVYIPVKGASGETQTVTSGAEHKTVYYHKAPYSSYRHSAGYDYIQDRKAFVVSKEEWEALPAHEQDIAQIPKVIQFKYLDPSMMTKSTTGRVNVQAGGRTVFTNLKDDARRTDVLSPYFETKSRHEFEGRARTAALHSQEWDRRIHTNPETEKRKAHLQKVLAQEPSKKTRHARLELDRLAAQEETPDEFAKNKGYKGIEEMKLLAGAAATTGLLNSRRQVQEGYLPKAVNSVFAGAVGKSSRLAAMAEKYNWSDELLNVNEAYTRPLQEKMANFGYSARHPLSSPYGSSYGIDWGQFRYRQKWINSDKMESRRLDRSLAMVERQKRAIDRVRSGREKGGITGRIADWRSEPVLRQREGFHDLAQRHRDLVDEYRWGNKANQATQYDPLFGAQLRGRDGSALTVHPSDATRDKAGYVSMRIKSMMLEEEKRGAIGPRASRTKIADRLAKVDWAANAGNVGKNPVVIGGAVLGAVAIGHYAYYKHQQKKLPESERVAYYNHILPKKFDVTVPHAHVTRVYKTGNSDLAQLTGFANRRIPVAAAFGTHQKEIALRPMDHGMAPNARIFGGVRSGKVKGGKLTDSVIYENHKWNNRRYDHGTHDIYVGGKKLPGQFDFGNGWNKVERTSRNPNKLSQKDREDIVWAYAGTRDEEAVRQFFRTAATHDKILDMFEDPDQVRNIRRKRGEKDAADILSGKKDADGKVSFVGTSSEAGPGMETAGFYSSVGTRAGNRVGTTRLDAAFMDAADVNSPAQRELSKNRKATGGR